MFRECAAVDVDPGFGAADGEIVQGAGNDLFAATGLPADENCTVGEGDPLDFLHQLAHRLADDDGRFCRVRHEFHGHTLCTEKALYTAENRMFWNMMMPIFTTARCP